MIDMRTKINKSMAPVVIFVYKRADHTRRLLEGLAKCSLADRTDVYIFSDGPKGVSDDMEVEEVRTLIRERCWEQSFGSLTIAESVVNKGLANSIIAGVTEVINEYGRVIVLEDDLLVAPGLLEYMNQVLDYFEEDKEKFAVTGWTYPLKSFENYNKDAWLFYRACSWGWGTWKDRWDKVVFDPDKAEFSKKLTNEDYVKNFSRGGNDLPGMLQMQLEGKRDSWAIRWNAWASELNMLTVYPVTPVIFNDGRDGSGTHCGEASYKQLEFSEGKKEYDFAGISLNDKLVREAWYFESDTLGKKLKRNLRTIFVDHKVPNVVRKIFG